MKTTSRCCLGWIEDWTLPVGWFVKMALRYFFAWMEDLNFACGMDCEKDAAWLDRGLDSSCGIDCEKA